MNQQTYVDALLNEAVAAARHGSARLAHVLDEVPEPIYVTDARGVLQHFNSACVQLAGRRPRTNQDLWCVTWKLYTPDGEFLPHDECPMAVAIREGRAVRDVEAIAERPDGTRVHFRPFPTPLLDEDGRLTGAVNLLLDVTGEKVLSLLELSAKCDRLSAISDPLTSRSLKKMACNYREKAAQLTRPPLLLNDT